METGDTAVLFVDMLGFGALLESTPDAVSRLRPIFQPLTSITTAQRRLPKSEEPLVDQFTKFHLSLEKRIRAEIPNGITAITFSDSAFIHHPNPRTLVGVARALMRDLIAARVPARMGIGAGSFAALRFMSDNTAIARVHAAQFLGTAVLRAYLAGEKSGKGLRIFLHPSMQKSIEGDLDPRALLPVPTAGLNAYAEVNILFMESSVKLEKSSVNRRWTKLAAIVSEMGSGAQSPVDAHYVQTTQALGRMRDALITVSVGSQAI